MHFFVTAHDWLCTTKCPSPFLLVTGRLAPFLRTVLFPRFDVHTVQATPSVDQNEVNAVEIEGGRCPTFVSCCFVNNSPGEFELRSPREYATFYFHQSMNASMGQCRSEQLHTREAECKRTKTSRNSKTTSSVNTKPLRK